MRSEQEVTELRNLLAEYDSKNGKTEIPEWLEYWLTDCGGHISLESLEERADLMQATLNYVLEESRPTPRQVLQGLRNWRK
jgi:hypothetical protein